MAWTRPAHRSLFLGSHIFVPYDLTEAEVDAIGQREYGADWPAIKARIPAHDAAVRAAVEQAERDGEL